MGLRVSLRGLLRRAGAGGPGRKRNTLFGALIDDRRGAVALIFGITLIPVLALAGGAIDYANAYKMRSKMQSALDSAALAAGRELDMGRSREQASESAEKVLEANLGPAFAGRDYSLSINESGKVVTATADMSIDTYILGVIGIDNLPIAATSTVNVSNGTFDVALVLDNSGSMRGSRIRDLREAASTLVETLFVGSERSDNVMIALVPFSGSVNVGPENATATWMDRTGRSSIHTEHFDDEDVTRWEMFDALRNTSWDGCVEVRPSPHDVADAPPDPGDGDTYFVPMFAPDEPDRGGDYPNSYIRDDGGDCKNSGRGRGRGRGRGGGDSQEELQSRTCKYAGERPDTRSIGSTRKGPNMMCDSQPILPLTNNKSVLLNAIDRMEAEGYTNIHHGVMWGWRAVSPEEPFTKGKPYDEPYHAKVMVLMTDGENTHPSAWNHNESWYTAYGYHAQGRLGAASNRQQDLQDAMDGKTTQACDNAKAADVIVYTIAFDISDSDTVAMLKNCATSSARAFNISDGEALIDAFKAIADDINRLRITS
jgi:Flp pilus assembly protein TadG